MTTLGELEPGDRCEPRGRRARQVRRAAPPAALASLSEMAVTTPVRDHRGGDRGHPRRTDGRRRRRSRPRERGRPGRSRRSSRRPRRSTSWRRTPAGSICLCLTEERADQLGLRPMTDHNEAPLGTAFTVSDRGARRRHDRHLRRRPQPHDPGRDPPRLDARTTSCSRATSSRSAPSRAACSSASARPRRRSTSRASPG